jgi:hypothetical protein
MDDSLRDLLALAVGEPPIRVSAETVRRRAVRRQVGRAAGATVVAAVVVAFGVTLSAGAIRIGPAGGNSGRHPAGPPRYYLVEEASRARDGKLTVKIAVRVTSTGRVTDVVPGVRAMICAGRLAAAGHDTFFVTCVRLRRAPGNPGARPGLPRGGKVTYDTTIYRFQVTSQGKVTGFSPVKGGMLKGVLAINIAASPDGSEIAAEASRPGPSGMLYPNTVPEGIFVINTATGARAFWHSGPYVPGAVQYAGAQDISFTRDGGELVLNEARCHRNRYESDCPGHDDTQVRAYAPAAGGGSLERGRVLLTDSVLKPAGTSLSHAVISPDGRSLTTVLLTCPKRGTCTLSVVQMSVATGRVLRQLYLTHTGTAFQDVFDRTFSTDPSGRYLILDAGAGKERVNGWIDHGRLVPLVPADGNDAGNEAW